MELAEHNLRVREVLEYRVKGACKNLSIFKWMGYNWIVFVYVSLD